MKIAKDTVVTIEYTLTDDDGDVIDSSAGRDPLSYVHGVGSLVPGLEAALEGRTAGDALTVAVAPAEGYGDHDPELVHVASRGQFAGIDDIEVGMRFQAKSDDETMVVTVVAVEGDQVTLDANHPLAGVTLNFDVKVVGVRQATAVEVAHGHPHGADGNDHHH
jgi:FKBP-type peptidyl-prolyl cis-trans isomerase SlyD